MGKDIKLYGAVGKGLNFPFPIRSNGTELCTKHISRSRVGLSGDWSFIGGSRIVVKPKATRSLHYPRSSQIHASCNPFSCYIHVLILKLSFTICVGPNSSKHPTKVCCVWILHTDETVSCHWASYRWSWRFL